MASGYLGVKRVGANPSLLFFVLLLTAPLLPIGSAFQAYCTQAAAVGIVVSLLMRWDLYSNRWTAIWATPAVRILAALLAWMVIQMLFQISPARGTSLQLAEFSRVVCGAAAFVGLALLLRSTRAVRWAYHSITHIGAAVAVVGIISWLIRTDVRAEGFTNNPQIFGAILALFIPFAVARTLKTGKSDRTLAITTACVIWVSLLLTGTRSSCFAAAVGSFIVIVLTPGAFERVRARRVDFAAMALILIGLFALAPTNKVLLHRLLMSTHDASVTDRISAWKTAVSVVQDHPLTGVGLGAFPLVASQYSHFWQLQTPAQIAIDGVGMTNLAHDEYLQIAADMGLPALLLFVGLLASCGIMLLKARKSAKTTTHHSVLIASIGVLSVFCIDCLANPATHFPIVSILFWAMMGLGLAATLQRIERRNSKTQPTLLPITMLLRRVQAPVTAAVFVVCVCGCLTNIGWAYPFSNLYFPGSVAPIASLLQTGTWGANTYSAGPSTISAKGGAVTTLAMALNGAGINNNGQLWDPGTLNTFMQQHSSILNGFNIGDFSGTSVNWGVTVADARKVSTGTTALQWNAIDQSQRGTGAFLGSILAQGYPVVTNIGGKVSPYFLGQMVLFTGLNPSGSFFAKNDPLTGPSFYTQTGYPFGAQGYIKNSSDLSEIDVSVVSTVQYTSSLLDPSGFKTSASTHSLANSAFTLESLDNETTGDASSDFSNQIQVLQPTAGKYTVQLHGDGLTGESYAGDIHGYSSNGTLLFDTPFSGTFAPAAATTTFTFVYSVPEPCSVGFIVSGCALLMRRRRQACC